MVMEGLALGQLVGDAEGLHEELLDHRPVWLVKGRVEAQKWP